MGTLTAALSWARRGFSVFPLRENDKIPISNDWHLTATTDPNIITSLWTDPVLKTERNYNIGCLCTDRVVVDVDIKEGKDGFNEYAQLGGHYDTLVVRTPTGGMHCYFMGPDSSNAPLSGSVDIRSHNGYVVAPGSSINGSFYIVANERPPCWVPPTVEKMLRPPNVRAEADLHIQHDNEASVAGAINFLQSCPVAVQGSRGDERTFLTAARLVREMALSVPTAFALMRDHWNPRCQPPWDWNELYAKIENAANYGSAEYGRLTAELLFGDIHIEPPPSVFEEIDWDNALLPERIPPRPWIMERALMTGAVTLLLAAGSAGKSTVSLAIAAHLALGKDFAGYKCIKAVKTIVYNGEDDRVEQSRRLLAVCMVYGFDYYEVKKNVTLLSSRDMKLDLVHPEHRRPVRNQAVCDQLIEVSKQKNIGLLIIDPLVNVHKCEESDNVQMAYVMETLTDIAHDARVGILVLHHTAKGGGRNDEKVGNMDIARGASAIVNACRIAFTLVNACKDDAEAYGFPDDERHQWVRLDDAKMNLALAGNKAIWFRREAIQIISGDMMGVLSYRELVKSEGFINERIGRVVISYLRSGDESRTTTKRAAAHCVENEKLWANKSVTECQRRIEAMFSTPLMIEGEGILKIVRENEKTFIVLN